MKQHNTDQVDQPKRKGRRRELTLTLKGEIQIGAVAINYLAKEFVEWHNQ